MQKVISARALLVNSKDELMLVTHKEISYWYVPGGKWEEDETLMECAEREVMEETGLKVNLEKLVYVDERMNKNREGEDRHYIAFFFFGRTDEKLSESWHDSGGTWEIITKFMSREEINGLPSVLPELLKDKFWEDYNNGFSDHQIYLSQK